MAVWLVSAKKKFQVGSRIIVYGLFGITGRPNRDFLVALGSVKALAGSESIGCVVTTWLGSICFSSTPSLAVGYTCTPPC